MALNTRPVEQPTTDPAETRAAATSDTLNRIRHRYFSKSDLAKGALDFRYYTKTALDALLTALAGYALLAGRAGGQTLRGGTASGENLTLQSTSHATRGRIVVEDTIGTAWAALTYGSGWGDYGGDYQAGQYKRVGDMVFLRGLVTRSSGTGTTIATLPTGYRPPARCLYGVHTAALSGADRVDVLTDGTVFLSSGNVDYVQLDGLSFSIAA